MAGAGNLSVRIVTNKLPSTAAAYEREITAAVKKAGFDIEAAGKSRAPVLTGTLRRSIHTVLSDAGKTAKVGPSVIYGAPVEYGARGRGPRPYMRPAFELVAPKFAESVKTILRKVY